MGYVGHLNYIRRCSPSLRTVSPLPTDCESEACGLKVRINRTGSEVLVRQTRAACYARTGFRKTERDYMKNKMRKNRKKKNRDLYGIRKCPSLLPVFAGTAFVEWGWDTGGISGRPSRLPPVFEYRHSLFLFNFRVNTSDFSSKFTGKTCISQNIFVPLQCIWRCVAVFALHFFCSWGKVMDNTKNTPWKTSQ